MNQTETKTYQLAGVTYRLECLSFQQAQWMGEHVLFDVDLGEIDQYRLHDLLRMRGHLLAAIALIPEGKTRRQKSEQPWAEIAQLATCFAATCEPGELEAVGAGFFFVNPLATLWSAVPGAQIKRIKERAITLAITNGSPTALSSSATEISPSSAPSSPNGAPMNAPTTSDDGSSTAPPSAPFLAGSASPSPG